MNAAAAARPDEGLICAFINKPFLHEEILRVIGESAARGEEGAGSSLFLE